MRKNTHIEYMNRRIIPSNSLALAGSSLQKCFCKALQSHRCYKKLFPVLDKKNDDAMLVYNSMHYIGEPQSDVVYEMDGASDFYKDVLDICCSILSVGILHKRFDSIGNFFSRQIL